MTQDELKMVLEALRWCHGGEPCGTAEAIAVVEKALAQQDQEPVAWPCLIDSADFSENTITLVMQCEDYKVSAGKHWLFTTPPQRTEPVIDKSAAIRIATALGWTPPRTWVGLTDGEIDNINYTSAYMLAREVEGKLKERNQ